jgi:hypothetical protein
VVPDLVIEVHRSSEGARREGGEGPQMTTNTPAGIAEKECCPVQGYPRLGSGDLAALESTAMMKFYGILFTPGHPFANDSVYIADGV